VIPTRDQHSGVADLLALVDSLVPNRAVIVGSLPPQGRDLDLLVEDPDEDALADGLARNGFVRAAGRWARFTDCAVQVVELIRGRDWALPNGELTQLFREAAPLPEANSLALPAPHHTLLILARRLAGGRRIGERQLTRLDAALERDPQAFSRAAGRAEAWGLDSTVVVLLERLYRERRAPTRQERTRAKAGRPRRRSAGLRPLLRSAGRARHRLRRGALVSFSGLDGSGKSSQTAYLRDGLDRLGYDAVAVWLSIANRPRWFDSTARVLKSPLIPLARLLSGRITAQQGAPPAPAVPRGEPVPARTGHPLTALRRRSSLLTFSWSMAITVQFALRVARSTWPHLLRGRVVVCDRYTMDSWVALLYKFGEDREYPVQLAILRALSPVPRRAYFLDVPGEVASARKSDFGPEQNARRAELYRARFPRLGVHRLDGTQPRDVLCAQVAAEVWESLRGPTRD